MGFVVAFVHVGCGCSLLSTHQSVETVVHRVLDIIGIRHTWHFFLQLKQFVNDIGEGWSFLRLLVPVKSKMMKEMHHVISRHSTLSLGKRGYI